ADRFAYLPTLPLFLLAGAAVGSAWVKGGRARTIALATAGALALALAVRTQAQIATWRDSETFWGHVVEAFPGQVVMAYNNLGALHHERALRTKTPADLDLAESEYRQAIAMVPNHANAWNNLGLIAEVRGQRGEAERCYRTALSISPRHPQATA